MGNLGDIKKGGLKRFEGRVLDVAKQIKWEVAKDLLARLASRSPVLTGRYVLSHRVGINGTDTTYEKQLPTLKRVSSGQRSSPQRGRRPHIDHRGVVSTVRGRGNAKIITAGLKDSISISNNVPWAVNVEFGWPTGAPGYHVYHLAYGEMRLFKQSAVNRVIKRMGMKK